MRRNLATTCTVLADSRILSTLITLPKIEIIVFHLKDCHLTEIPGNGIVENREAIFISICLSTLVGVAILYGHAGVRGIAIYSAISRITGIFFSPFMKVPHRKKSKPLVPNSSIPNSISILEVGTLVSIRNSQPAF